MNFKYKSVPILAGIIILYACQSNLVKKEIPKDQNYNSDVPDNLWISESFISKADSIIDYYNVAKQKLVEGDTIGAEIYFDQAFEILF